ncbi:hypothetical protein BGY98DRAFT_972965 [Russula aff. rugulosa BPL654]|nr:hypothetical protein BGY98DRAFT_972965 [Russula aff. rugulosa BPL654]
MGDISQAPAETLLTSAHSDSPTFVFVADPGDDPDTLQPITLAAMLSRPPENNEQQDATTSCASLNTDEILSTDNPTPVHSYGMTTEMSPSSSLESTPIQPDHILDAPRSPLSSLTKFSSRIPCRLPPFRPPRCLRALGHLTPMPAHDVVSNALSLEGLVQREPDKS